MEGKAAVESEFPVSVRRFVWSHYPDCGFPGRVNHCAVLARNDKDSTHYMYSLGGFHATDEERVQTLPDFGTGPIDILCMDIATCNWVNVDCISKTENKDISIRGGVPPRRYGHTCVAYGDKIFMYGGFNDDDGSFKIMECFDVTRSMWLKIHATPEGCSLPQPRDGHACTVSGNIMYMHGGFNPSGSYCFIDEFNAFNMDTHTWTLLPQDNDELLYRDFHTLTYIKGALVLFGGRTDVFAPAFSNQDVYETSFYEYVLDEKKWTIVEPSGYQPEGRRSHCAVRYSEDKVLYFGGYNSLSERHFNDVFIYDSLNRHVTEIKPFGIPPVPRRRSGHCIINNEIIFCGGTSPIEIMIKKMKRRIMHDHSDTFVLSLLPTLQQLAMIAVKELELDAAVLPIHIRQQLQNF